MKILFDCRYTRLDRHDGISRYTTGLVTALAELHPVTMLISDPRQLSMLPDLPWILGSGVTSVHEPWIAHTVNQAEPDVVFSPMQTMGSLGRQYRLILTLHDLIYYTNRTPPRNLSWPIKLLWRAYHLAYWPQRIVLGRGDAIVTVSETARAQIVQHRLARRPITVVRSAVAEQERVDRMPPARRNLIYMGSFMPYKNVETLLAAMHLLPGYQLHLLSGIASHEAARLSKLAPAGAVVFENGVSDEEYLTLLRNATALVTASREEGFGIPVAEAMAAGTPVVISDIPVFHEVGGAAALYFPPDDAEALAEAVLGLERPGEWEKRSALAYERATEFTWRRSAQTLLELATSLTEQR
ncbi:MAG TPA: glycosyltransferase family 1 protein [Microbacteriaceae bacterium]